MPLTAYGDQQMLQALFGAVTTGIPTSSTGYYIGLIKAKGIWTATTAYVVGDLVVPTAFSTAGTTNRMFRCTTAGTSGSAEPTWSSVATSGASSVDGTNTVWTEVTAQFYTSANVLGYEVSGGGYARRLLANAAGSTQWVAPSLPSSSPASTNWGSVISFPASTASQGYVVGFFLADALTTGNVFAWGTLSNYVPVLASGMTLTLPATTGVTVTLA
jgi:hypothetical protein